MDRRLGIRVKLRVSGELRPALRVENPHLDYSGTSNPFGKGSATVTYTIHNTGNAMLSARQKVSVAGPFGRLRTDAGKVAASPELLPGERWKVTVPVSGVAPAGRLTATVTLTPLLTDASGTTTPLDRCTAPPAAGRSRGCSCCRPSSWSRLPSWHSSSPAATAAAAGRTRTTACRKPSRRHLREREPHQHVD
ncbi:hypothetical protein [Actinacidiphila paucisporea]|uniref:hypothetical protein n=1 Tax=Actinacidiphila paucisporea TaxID=310782 RepID=UPI00190E945B|nr:hypothetical protein [Actinacidiphila paucisporea]